MTMRVTVRGVTYPSAHEAAAAHGVAVATVYCAISRGRIDRLGLGPDYKARKHGGGQKPQPVTVAGQRFASLAELARAIGRTPKAVRVSWKRGQRESIVLAVMRLVAERENKAMKENWAWREHPEN